MSVSSVGFVMMDDVKDVRQFLASAQKSINAFVKESYEKNNVKEKFNIQFPFVLFRSTMDGYDYRLFEFENRFSETYMANFNVFVSENEFSNQNAHDDLKPNKESSEIIPNEARTLYIHTDTSDYKEEIEGQKIVVSLGSWGHSEEIINRIFKDFGQPYYFTNDDGCEFDKVA